MLCYVCDQGSKWRLAADGTLANVGSTDGEVLKHDGESKTPCVAGKAVWIGKEQTGNKVVAQAQAGGVTLRCADSDSCDLCVGLDDASQTVLADCKGATVFTKA